MYMGLMVLSRLHTYEPYVPDSSPSEVEFAIAKLKRYKSPGIDQILAERFHYVLGSLNALILFGIRNNCFRSGTTLLLYQFTRRVIKPTAVIVEANHCCQLHTKFYPVSFSES
jgi:hypothetical protein